MAHYTKQLTIYMQTVEDDCWCGSIKWVKTEQQKTGNNAKKNYNFINKLNKNFLTL